MPTQVTAPSTLRLSEVARHVVIPDGIVTTAWPRVVAKCRELDVEFDEWQAGIGAPALGKREDGRYACSVGGVVLSIPRQVGKTFLVAMIVIALCLIFPGLTVLWTAHHNRTSTKTFQTFKALTGRRKILPHMLEPRNSNGEQEIRFRNGSRVLFGAREQGFGRGFDEVDVEVFDEAQILSAKALEDMVPATNQSRQPAGALLFFMGTPPRPTDPGEEFTNRRDMALAGTSEDMLYVEFSADDGADPDDRAQWSKANPSFPSRTPLEAMRRMKANLTDEASFLREGLGVWDDLSSGVVISPRVWAEHRARDPQPPVGDLTFALDVSPMRDLASIAVCGMSVDGDPQVELTNEAGRLDHSSGTDWIIPRLRALTTAWDIREITIVAGSQAETLREDLEDLGLDVNALKHADFAIACGVFYDAATAGTLRHLGQPDLDRALELARPREFEHGWTWGRKKSTGDITPIVAATLAAAGCIANTGEVSVMFWDDNDEELP